MVMRSSDDNTKDQRQYVRALETNLPAGKHGGELLIIPKYDAYRIFLVR